MTEREKLIDLLTDVLGMSIASKVDHLLSNNVVPVVRCIKCKWYDPESEYCQFWHGVRHPGHYCGEGDSDGI